MASGNKNITGSAQVRWAIEYFGYETPYADAGLVSKIPTPPMDLSLSLPKVSVPLPPSLSNNQNLIFADQYTADYITQMVKNNYGLDYGQKISAGVRSIQFSRSKDTPVSECQFSITGHVPSNLYNGGWVVITSAVVKAAGQVPGSSDTQWVGEPLIRFIGQLFDFKTSYQRNAESNVLNVVSTFRAREWSYALTMPLRYDLLSIEGQQAATLPGLSQRLAIDSKTYNNIKDIVSAATNSFQFAHIVLAMLGAISNNDKDGIVSQVGAKKIPAVAVAPPKMPKALLDRLGLSATDPSDPYETGFVKVITGVLKESACNNGKWDGVFGSKTSTITSVDKYADAHKIPEARPLMTNMVALLQNGVSAWDLLTGYCEPATSDIYTDFLYEKVGQKINSRPTIFVKDKPFLIKKLEPQLLLADPMANLEDWTRYDDLPRIRIDNRYIASLTIGQSILNSPNVFRVNFMSPAGGLSANKAAAQTAGFGRMDEEAARHGGKEWFIESQYSGLISEDFASVQNSPIAWYTTLKVIGKAWHGALYKMGYGGMVLKDYNVPLTVGSNIQFTIGEYEVVAHLERVDVSHQVSEIGVLSTMTNLSLARIVKANPNGSLDFFTPHELRSLIGA